MVAAVLAAAPLLAAAQESSSARSLAATCAHCHGTEGHSVTPEMRPLAGMPKAELIETLKAFRDGRRPATVMQQLAKGYSDAQLELIADFFSRQPR